MDINDSSFAEEFIVDVPASRGEFATKSFDICSGKRISIRF